MSHLSDAHPNPRHTWFTRNPHNRWTHKWGPESPRSAAETEAAPAMVARVALGARGAHITVGSDHRRGRDDVAADRGVLTAALGDADGELVVGDRVAAAVHHAGDGDGARAEAGRLRLPTRSAHGPHSATGPPFGRLPNGHATHRIQSVALCLHTQEESAMRFCTCICANAWPAERAKCGRVHSSTVVESVLREPTSDEARALRLGSDDPVVDHPSPARRRRSAGCGRCRGDRRGAARRAAARRRRGARAAGHLGATRFGATPRRRSSTISPPVARSGPRCP